MIAEIRIKEFWLAWVRLRKVASGDVDHYYGDQLSRGVGCVSRGPVFSLGEDADKNDDITGCRIRGMMA